ncbi:MAG: hypothetical protein IPK98_11295 [Chloracidobacterium sp.]|nr:hypothetical protein [Chloracidobacterium sp.]
MSEHNATSDYPSGGYMQNADYTYAADSKPISMDNHINNGFDRTFKFDFAGRLTANSFGTVTSNTGSGVRPAILAPKLASVAIGSQPLRFSKETRGQTTKKN